MTAGHGRTLRLRLRRLVATVAVVLLSLYALYVVALNVFLSTSLFERLIDRDPETIFITYQRGWTVWPGTIHARKLSVRSSDSHIQFLLRVETCEFDVSLVDLVRKQFHLTRVLATGVTFDARRRIDGPSATPELLDALPVLPGFERIPFRLPGPPDVKERWDDRYYHLWTIHLEGVTARDVRRLWIDGTRFDGDAQVTGSLYLKPIRAVEAGPVHVEIFAGRATLKQRVVAETLTGSVDARLWRFDPRSAETGALMNHITVGTELRGRSPDVANFPRELTAPLRVSGPADVRRLALRLEDGRLEKDTHLDLIMVGASVDVAHHRFAGDLELLADIPSGAGGSQLTFRIAARSIAVGRRIDGDESLLLVAPVVKITGDATSLDLRTLLSDLHVVALVPHIDLHDGRALGQHMPDGTAVGFGGAPARGQGRIEAWLAERRLKLEAHLQAKDVDVRIAKARLRGSAKLDASVDAWRLETKRLEGVQVKLELANGSLASVDAPERHVLDLRSFDVAADAAEIAQGDPTSAFHATIRVEGAEIFDRAPLERWLPEGRAVPLVNGRVRFGVRSELEVANHRVAGTLDLHSARIDVRLGRLDLRAALRVRARVHDWAWERGDLAIDEAKAVLTDVSGRTEDGRAPALTVARVAVEVNSKRFSFSDPLDAVDYHLMLEDARGDDLGRLGALLPAAGAFVLEAGQARADVDIAVTRSDGKATGSARLVLENARLKAVGSLFAGTASVVVNVKGFDRDREAIDISDSSVMLRDVSVTGDSGEVSGWKGEVNLLQGALRLSGSPSFDAFAQLHADNAKPLLAILIGGASLPKFLLGPLAAEGLSGQGRITLQPGWAAILGGRLGGDDVIAYGDCVVVGERVRGAAIVAKGPLSAGVSVDDRGTHLRLFGLEGWLERERRDALSLLAEGQARNASH